MSGPSTVSGGAGESTELLLDVPSPLKMLARHVVRGFYPLEEALIVDMLVRYPCLREEDLASKSILRLLDKAKSHVLVPALLKFDTKLLRSKIAGLHRL